LNHGPVAVCTGRKSVFLADRKVATRIIDDSLCFSLDNVVPPGEARTWSEAWSVAGCLREMPEGFAEAFKELMCGTSVPLRVETEVFRVVDGVQYFGGSPLVSNSIVVTRKPRASSLPSNLSSLSLPSGGQMLRLTLVRTRELSSCHAPGMPELEAEEPRVTLRGSEPASPVAPLRSRSAQREF
jgi:hypothetical protein